MGSPDSEVTLEAQKLRALRVSAAKNSKFESLEKFETPKIGPLRQEKSGQTQDRPSLIVNPPPTVNPPTVRESVAGENDTS